MLKTIPRIMLAAGASGSGKTLLTCGLLQVLVNRRIKTVSFKCGPDYIDPMFHTQVIGTKSRNLDTFFTGEEITRSLLAKNSADCEMAVMEGVMGFYDGVAGTTTQASAYDLARVTDTPVILIVNSKGMSVSLAAYIKGFMEYKKDSRIKGVIFNQMSPMLYPRMKKLVEEELGIKALGYVPKVEDCVIESRHLGLVLPEEIPELKQRLLKLADVLEGSLDIEAIIQLAKEAPELSYEPLEEEKTRASIMASEPEKCTQNSVALSAAENTKQSSLSSVKEVLKWKSSKKLRIGLAKDEAFCFYYRDNLRMLEHYGAELVFFSPLHDEKLPENIHGLLLGGGYPELYAKQLEENESMRKSIKEALEQQLPSLAECGGFMYLHDTLTDREGTTYQMAGVIPAECQYTGKLVRFGYVEVQLPQGLTEKGTAEMPEPEKIKAHEFHYFDSTANGEDCIATKPVTGRSWKCIHASDDHFWGFPHLYYPSDPKFVEWFLERTEKHI